MDSMEANKTVAAILVAGIAFFITGLLGDNLVYEERPAKPAIPVQAAPAEGAGGGAQQPTGPAPIVPLLASANVQKGEAFAKQVCTACHTFDQGGKPLVGPNLYGIVGAPHDHEAGFDYSAALQKFKGQPWTYEALNKWLYDPQAYAPGTRMTYAGVKSTQQRADLIAWLRTLSPHPVPLPSAEEVAKAEQAAKPAETAAAPAAEAPTGPPAIAPLLASANVQKGKEIVSQVCGVCHTFNQGGKPLVGPNLYGIVEAPHDHEPGFDYSAALQKFKGQPWTYDALNKWLYDPQAYAPGTRMTYAGLKSTQQRADVIAYLRTLSPNPAPLPAATEGPTKAAETAPAPGTAAPAGNKSALGSAEAPNSAPASSPNVLGPPGQAYNPNAQTPNVGTQVGGGGTEPHAGPNAPANANKP
ncbi:MAG TPA: c-type cytochrome [Acetobacteraceae bacterium]|nr:c-type cytochrome [Acetobacteraceae bacterium]